MTSHSGTPPRKSPPCPEINRSSLKLDPAPDLCPQATGSINVVKNKTANFLPNFSMRKRDKRKSDWIAFRRLNLAAILQQSQSGWQTFIHSLRRPPIPRKMKTSGKTPL